MAGSSGVGGAPRGTTGGGGTTDAGAPGNDDAGAGAGGEAGAAGGDAGIPVDCESSVMAPASFETLEGFTNSEDFAFDELGNYVGVDGDNNLVRVSRAGKKTLWAPAIGTTAGMAMLPDGSVVIADVANGAVKRVYANGASQVVLGGLLYPNGLDIGPDGFIYVAENNAGRVRRVDPETGAFTIAAMGLKGPNGVAFSEDPKVFYVGSFEGSGVYKVEVPEPGALGVAKVFARPSGSTLPEPVLACPDQQVDKECTLQNIPEPGKCRKLSNVVDCLPDGPCLGKAAGTSCEVNGKAGTCSDNLCQPIQECVNKANGTSCTDDWGSPGTCSGGACAAVEPCTGQADGTSCKTFGLEGTCAGGQCALKGECDGKPAGAACTAWADAPGTCSDGQCLASDPCREAVDGTACTVFGSAGSCDGGACKVTAVCDDKQAGEACIENGYAGVCKTEGQFAWCEISNPCAIASGPCDGPGGIDGLGVDACGYVYASEYSSGIVWRISPKGDLEKLATLPSQWIPNIKWGRGLGGFERNVMYVADRNGSRLFGVAVARPGATEYFDLSKP